MQMKTIQELPELVGPPPMAGGGGGRGFSRQSNGSMRGNAGGNNRNGGRSSKMTVGHTVRLTFPSFLICRCLFQM